MPNRELDISVADRDRPSSHGKLFGEVLAEIAAEGRKHATAFSFEMCLTCAFREGCMTNQCTATGIMALNCIVGIDPDDFACHHGMKDGAPTKLCAGYLAAKLAPFEFTREALIRMMARLDGFEGPDQVRADYDAWRASIDPEGKMDAYQLARAYAGRADAKA